MIVLLTDFGESEYVGMMKGVIHSIHPAAQVIDLTHSISSQSIREGAWVLLQSYGFFPHSSIFVCVVDPGVGTPRDAVAVRTTNYTFVGPDNGLMYPAAVKDGIKNVYTIPIDESSSKTFHGRDVFARVAGHFASGRILKDIGAKKPTLDEELVFFQREQAGEVVRIDRFGNIVTNIPPSDNMTVSLQADTIERSLIRAETYEQGPEDGLFVVVGSSGTLEISAKNSRAVEMLPLKVGDRLVLE